MNNTEIIKKIEAYNTHFSEDQKKKLIAILDFLQENYSDTFNTRIEILHCLLTIKPDMHTIFACLLHESHDLIIPNEIIQSMICNESFILIEELKSISSIHYQLPKNAEIIQRYLLSKINDVRVLHIRIAKSIGMLSYISKHHTKFSKKTIQQTVQAVYFIIIPILSHLGIYKLKQHAQDLYFLLTNPNEYHALQQSITIKKEKIQISQEHTMCETIEDILVKNNIHTPIIYQRTKGIFSTYKKIKHKDYHSIDEVKDLFGMRIIVNTVQECYETLSVLHTKYLHENSHFIDYIANPKDNGYQSIHTILQIENKQYLEVQIRTHEMNINAELGTAAHSQYKGETSFVNKTQNKNTPELSKNINIFNHLKSLLPKKIYPMTPTGEIKELPIGSTPLDFAYSIHSDIGDHCRGALINEKIVPLNTELKSEDMVDILTDTKQHPKKEWLDFIVSSSARHKIKSYLYSIGENVLAKIHNTQPKQKSENIQNINNKIPKNKTNNQLIIGGESDLIYHFAKCCTPEDKEELVAYASQSRDFIIHHKNCFNLQKLDKTRIVPVTKKGI